jgi:hypothetical protein
MQKCNRELLETFIEKATKVHGSKYDYSNVEYRTCYDNVEVICKEHGVFNITPTSHINKGTGCPVCRKLDCTKKCVDAGRVKINEKFNNKFELPIDVPSTSTRVVCKCPVHGEFTASFANMYSSKYGCEKCGIDARTKSITYTTEEYITRANEVHKNRYTYDNVEYVRNSTKISITCKLHGDFIQSPSAHLSGYGCKYCSSYGKGRTRTDIPCTLYYFNIIGTDFYKVGITALPIEKRYRTNKDRDKIVMVFTKEYHLGELAYQVEQNIIRGNPESIYKGAKLLSSGNTEIFTKDVFNGNYEEIYKYEKGINE